MLAPFLVPFLPKGASIRRGRSVLPMCARLRMSAKRLGLAPIGRHGHVFAMPASLSANPFSLADIDRKSVV